VRTHFAADDLKRYEFVKEIDTVHAPPLERVKIYSSQQKPAAAGAREGLNMSAPDLPTGKRPDQEFEDATYAPSTDQGLRAD
jgi:hypothetical protein